MSKRYHISTSIDGLLRKTDKELSRLFFGDGKVIRDELLNEGVKLIDTKDETTYEFIN